MHDLSYFLGKNVFGDDGSQNMLVYGKGQWNFSNGYARNLINFGSGNSSSSRTYNCKKIF